MYREIGTDATKRCGLDDGADAGKTRADLDHGVSVGVRGARSIRGFGGGEREREHEETVVHMCATAEIGRCILYLVASDPILVVQNR